MQRGHEKLSTFGLGAALSEQEWRAVFRQLVAFGYLAVDHDGFGALVLTDASKAVLKGEQNVTLRKYVKPTRTRQSSRAAQANAPTRPRACRRASKARWERLRAWRARQAKSDGVPAYVIFHDATLAEIARNDPDSIEDLRQIPGIGARKLDRFGRNCSKSSAPTSVLTDIRQRASDTQAVDRIGIFRL